MRRRRLLDGDGTLTAEGQLAVGGGVDHDDVAVGELALEEGERHRVAHLALDHPLERPRPEVGVVARSGDVGQRGVGELQAEVALGGVSLALGLVALILAETAAAEVLLAVFMGSIIVVWTVELLDHVGALSRLHPAGH